MAAGPSGELQSRNTQLKTVKDLLEKSRDSIASALPRSFSADRMVRIAYMSVYRNPGLLECSKESLIGAVLQCAQLGLEPNILGHAYLVPFYNNKKGCKEVQFMPGYKGLIDLSRRSGQISTIFAKVVYENDDYAVTYGTDPKIEHVPHNSSDHGPMKAVYAVAKLRDGGIQFEAMWKTEVDAVRKRSKSGESGPWVTDYEEMAKKTVLRRLCKLLPTSIEVQHAVALDEQAEAGLPQDLDMITGVTDPADNPSPSKADALKSKLSETEPEDESRIGEK